MSATPEIGILYRDDDLLVINKPAGASLLADRSGAPELWARLKELAPVRMVHRIDKGTSGVLALALSASCQSHLTKAFADHRVGKFYVAGVSGRLALGGRSGVIELPLARGRKSRFRVAGQREHIRREGNRWRLSGHASAAAKDSLTRLRVIAASDKRSWLIARPWTGRTHQIRVHLAWIGHALLGDHLYGKPDDATQRWQRLALHSHALTLPRSDGTYVTFRAPVPADLGVPRPGRRAQ